MIKEGSKATHNFSLFYIKISSSFCLQQIYCHKLRNISILPLAPVPAIDQRNEDVLVPGLWSRHPPVLRGGAQAAAHHQEEFNIFDIDAQ